MYYIFDGTYNGLLCCVFESFERKEFAIIPQLQQDHHIDIFTGSRHIESHPTKSKRVYDAILKKLGPQVTLDFYRVFLSEDRRVWKIQIRLIQQIFRGQEGVMQNYGDLDVLYFAQVLKKVGRERHRMKAFIRFQKSADGLYFAMIEPDFNVLPLIVSFFKNRYTDQSWLIYDVRRKYGLLYDKISVTEVVLSAEEKFSLSTSQAIDIDEKEAYFQQLWKSYYKSTNIEARRNMKLHLQHVPKRYWKYLTEKR